MERKRTPKLWNSQIFLQRAKSLAALCTRERPDLHFPEPWAEQTSQETQSRKTKGRPAQGWLRDLSHARDGRGSQGFLMTPKERGSPMQTAPRMNENEKYLQKIKLKILTQAVWLFLVPLLKPQVLPPLPTQWALSQEGPAESSPLPLIQVYSAPSIPPSPPSSIPAAPSPPPGSRVTLCPLQCLDFKVISPLSRI